ncbi:hypothetical protein KIJ04_04570 [Leuconostoc gelidum subsp. gelidum]|uniref:capsular polysaccharide synthesis protein n=1 Tax=Leuconostoc gelidum TaxID=1244 RepID=UPI001CC5E115|nr:capsular polysaccharide synthesis protein [Leuconostoc gelidum]MBZ6014019.1 hypothetical protein [Leuconostoc gelidum subsp. gelidum]
MQAAPELVQLNYKKLVQNTNEAVVLITKDNIEDYVQLPKRIYDKWYSGTIPDTQFSDILRAQLLSTYGGIWIDSTVTLLDKLPKYFADDFFIYKSLKPGKNGLALPFSSWDSAAHCDNPIIQRTRDLLVYYWLKNNENHEYFVFHRMLKIALEEYPNAANLICPVDNSQPHALLVTSKNMLLTKQQITNFFELSSIHKLSYKIETAFQKENNGMIINYLSKK